MTTEEYIRDDILDSEEMRKVHIAGLPSTVEDTELKTVLETQGGTCELSVVRKEGKKKNVFAFATFETSEQVDELLLNRASLKLNVKALDVKRAVPKTNTWHGAHEKTKKLFIANLPRSTTEDGLTRYLKVRHPSKYGEIESIKLIKKMTKGERTEENIGYGFIEVSCEDLADKMQIQHNSFTYGGRKIELKKHVPSSDGGGVRGKGRGGGRGGKFQQQGDGGFNNGYSGQQWGPDFYGAPPGYGYGGGFNNGAFGRGGFGRGAFGAFGRGGFGLGRGASGRGAFGRGGFAQGGFGGYGGGFGGGYGAPRGRGARFLPY